MMDLSHCDDLVEGQDRGADLTIIHPVTAEKMRDIVITVAGPDSDVQRRARTRFADDLMAFRNNPPGDELNRMEIERLARCIVGWRITRDGKPFEFSFTNAVKLLTNFTFIRDQVEAFAASRAAYFKRCPVGAD